MSENIPVCILHVIIQFCPCQAQQTCITTTDTVTGVENNLTDAFFHIDESPGFLIAATSCLHTCLQACDTTAFTAQNDTMRA